MFRRGRDLRNKKYNIYIIFPFLRFSVNPFTKDEFMEKFVPIYSGLTKSLPENVHLLTMERIDRNRMIIRFEHFYEEGEDAKLSRPTTIQLKGLFTDFEITSMIEMNLSANQLLKDKKMWNWKTTKYTETDIPDNASKRFEDAFSVYLKPMEIRTFIAEVEYR